MKVELKKTCIVAMLANVSIPMLSLYETIKSLNVEKVLSLVVLTVTIDVKEKET